VAVAATILVVTGCGSGGGGAPAVPAGFTRYQDAKLSFAYPSAWTLRHVAATAGHPAGIEVIGPKGLFGLAPQILVGVVNTVSSDVSPASGLEAVSSASAAQDAIQLQNWREVRNTVVKVRKARAASLRIAEFTESKPGETTITVRVFDLEAVRPPNVVYDLKVAAAAADAIGARLQEIVDSFRFR
jgi:hypothetical protein